MEQETIVNAEINQEVKTTEENIAVNTEREVKEKKEHPIKTFLVANEGIKTFFTSDRKHIEFVVLLMSYLKQNDLMGIQQQNLWHCVIKLLQYDLKVGEDTFLIPYLNHKTGITKVEVIVGYKALIKMARKDGIYIDVEAVYINDVFSMTRGTKTEVNHEINQNQDRGELVGFYALAKLPNGDYRAIYKTKSELEELNGSKNQTNKRKEIIKKKDTEFWMLKKTLIIQLLKTLPFIGDILVKEEYEAQDSKQNNDGLTEREIEFKNKHYLKK